MKKLSRFALPVFLFLLIAGILSAKISHDLKKNAMRDLKTEEMTAAAQNRQILGKIKVIEDFKELEKKLNECWRFHRSLDRDPVAECRDVK